MSTLYVDNLEPNLGSQVEIPDLKPLAGSVVQVVQATSLPGQVASQSTSFVDTNAIEIQITPTLANSKVLVEMSGFIAHVNPNADNWGGAYHIYRDVNGGGYAAVNGTGNPLWGAYKHNQYSDSWTDEIAHMRYLDSPTYNVGDLIKYRAYFRKSTRGASGFYAHHIGGLAYYAGNTNVVGIAQEIAQ